MRWGEYNLTFAEASMLSKLLKTVWSGGNG